MIPRKIKNLAIYFQTGGVYEVLPRLSAAELLPDWLLYFCETKILRLDSVDPRTALQPVAGYVYEQVGRQTIDELLACSNRTGSPAHRKFFSDSFNHGA